MNINLLQYFEQTVAKNPNKVAVKEGANSLDFKTLQWKAKSVASFIKLKTNRRFNAPIAVFLPKSIDCITADIAATYSGNPFMNLDVNAPSNRIFNIISLIEPVVIISRTDFIRTLPEVSPDIIIVDINQVDYNNPEAENDMFTVLLDNIIDTDPFCIVNTSGSTGTPKGVTLSHRNYINYTAWATNEFSFDGSEILGVLSPPFFDHFNFEICLMMFKGSKLIILENNLAVFPIKLLEILKQDEINFIFWVPTIMVNIANMDLFSVISLDKLKMIWFAGEVFPTKQFNYWRKQIPHATFVNLYGPTEITVDCTFYKVNRVLKDSEPIPIGKSCRNTGVLILDEDNALVDNGSEGELCVRGSSLAHGYYNNWQKTMDVFIQNPLNKHYPELIYKTGDIVSVNEFDEIIYKGRKDGYIKHLGYRIELGEIEHVIVNVLQMVKNCCVVYQTEKKEITTFYESQDDITDGEFRKRLLEHFPKYMIPSKYVRMNELPRNTNGKIDRLNLKNFVNGN